MTIQLILSFVNFILICVLLWLRVVDMRRRKRSAARALGIETAQAVIYPYKEASLFCHKCGSLNALSAMFFTAEDGILCKNCVKAS